ncbi:type ISP restriction/modification enzyme [Thermocrinis sp.]|jgi:predicted helicase|uniref:type ISP restriction/modification enzyme n=1 Tax=Thermocrinis sp. TaxID=2024383 RepID=UPI003C066596
MQNVEKGRLLEVATKLYLEKQGFRAYLWQEWASQKGLPLQDTGIDLVAEKDGELYAVQCKNWDRAVSWRDVGTFLGSLLRRDLNFKGGFLVAKSVSKEVEREIERLGKTIIPLSVDDLSEYLDQAKALLEGKPLIKEKKQLRPYQEQAVQSVLEGFKSRDRGKLIMPPGTGKTLVALRIAESFGEGKLILFLCPSIALLDQSIKAWFKDSELLINAYAVVSDRGVGRDDELNRRSLLSFPATTSAEELLGAFRLEQDKLNVIFSTYQSLDVIKEAQQKGLPEFDLIICDEAHRTAGVSKREETNFKLVHSNEHIKGKKRLYMTATPKVFDVGKEERERIEEENLVKIFDMSDEEIFGPTFFEYSFRRAIEEGYLSPYRIVVMTVDKKEVQEKLYHYFNSQDKLSIDDTTKLVGLGKLIKGEVLNEDGTPLNLSIKRGIVFVNRVKTSEKIAKNFEAVFREYFGTPSPAEIQHVDGNMPVFEKRNKINWLREGGEKSHILTNAKVLTEGIDVPALDFVAFFDPKESVVDIIQALGRVVRKAENKEFGLVFIPLVVSTDKGDIDEQIERTSYKTLWQVLNAVASLDSAFQSQIRVILIEDGNRTKETDLNRDNVIILDRGNTQPSLFEPIRKYLSTKIVRSFRLGAIFLKDWAQETAKTAKDLRDHVQIALEKDPTFRQKFEELRRALTTLLNESISDQDVLNLVVQYILTKPIFDAVFEHKSQIDEILDSIFEYFKHFLQNNIRELDKFYEQVQAKASGLRNEEERQEFLRHLYTNFFSVAFKETTDEVGIAYTPVPLVSFIVKFVNYLVQKHFGRSLDDEGVVILEPFAGMGTFISIAIENMEPQKLEEKLKRKEIWANEILLLPYMAMVKNIESTIARKTGKHLSFETALWTDSFSLMEKLYEKQAPKLPMIIPEKFKELIDAQLKAKVNVIISNPPWRAKRENENVGRRNVEYRNLRMRIEQTYAKYSKQLGTTNVNSLYDTYIQALRMASDRIEEGVIGFVLNNGWLKGLAGRGVRKALSEEFAEVYVYDLKGDARTRGEERRRQGENVFGDQSRAGVCLLFLVKRKDKKGPAKIHYKAVRDYAKKEEKFAELREWEDKPDQIEWQEIRPNQKHDWIDQGEEEFESLLKLGDKRNKNDVAVFDIHSLGLNTGRDPYAYNFSRDELRKHMERLIDTFNEHLEKARRGEITKENVEGKVEKDQRKIKWDSALKDWLFKLRERQRFKDERVFSAFYRPFVPMWAYFEKVFNSRTGQLSSIFPTPDAENLVIVVMSPGKGGEFNAAIADRIVDYGYIPRTTVFPLYTYTEVKTLYGTVSQKQYNISDQALRLFQKALNYPNITKEDIFFYVFGILSTPSYVERFRNNLSKELPRVPILDSFWEISKLGRELAELQLAYQRYVWAMVMKEEREEVPEYSNLTITADENALKEYVGSVRLDKENREITINGKVKVQGIPEFAFECKVGNYPPIRWVSEYLVREEDKDTGIVWDPMLKVEEFVDIVKKLIAFSERCLEIKQQLRKIYEGSNPVKTG